MDQEKSVDHGGRHSRRHDPGREQRPTSATLELGNAGRRLPGRTAGQFATDVQAFVDTLFATPPFDELQSAINVFRVDVSSTDSGADDPTACPGGTGATARTYSPPIFT